MTSVRRLMLRGLVIVGSTLVALTAPSPVPWALLAAFAIVAHDGPYSRTTVWLAGWLLLLEIATASPLGTLSLPFCLVAVLTAGARHFISLGFWSERAGWSPADALRTVGLSFVLGSFGIVGWVLMGLLDTAPALVERFGAVHSWIPGALVWIALVVLLVRASTVPFRRTIVYSGT